MLLISRCDSWRTCFTCKCCWTFFKSRVWRVQVQRTEFKASSNYFFWFLTRGAFHVENISLLTKIKFQSMQQSILVTRKTATVQIKKIVMFWNETTDKSRRTKAENFEETHSNFWKLVYMKYLKGCLLLSSIFQHACHVTVKRNLLHHLNIANISQRNFAEKLIITPQTNHTCKGSHFNSVPSNLI